MQVSLQAAQASPSPLGGTRFHHGQPLAVCQGSPSLVAQPTPCRCTSGSADVVRLSPCSTCLPVSPSRYAPGADARCGGPWASQWLASPLRRGRAHQHLALYGQRTVPSSAFPPESVDQVLS